MRGNPYSIWFNLGIEAWQLGMEASQVASMRLARMAVGGPGTMAEGGLMVTEKIAAALELQAAAITGQLGTTAASGTAKTLRHYRGKVAANKRRLGRRS